MLNPENTQVIRDAHPTPMRIIRIKDVMSMTGISRSHIYQLATTGVFPKSISLIPGGTSVGWIESEIENWISQRIKGSAAKSSTAMKLAVDIFFFDQISDEINKTDAFPE